MSQSSLRRAGMHSSEVE